MRWQEIFFVICILVLPITFLSGEGFAALSAEKIPELDTQINTQGELKVIVLLNDEIDTADKQIPPVGLTSDKDRLRDTENFRKTGMQKKERIALRQEQVLSALRVKDGQNNQINQNKNEKNVRIITAEDETQYDFELIRRYSTIFGFAGTITKSGYEKLKNNPAVAAIIPDTPIYVLLDQSVPLLNATNVWRLMYNGTNVTGKGQSVCVIDTGVDYTHPALGGCTAGQFTSGTCSKVITGHDFVNNDNDPIDDHGHGTHVAGIISSQNETYKGIAPDASIVAIKVCTSGGSCGGSDVVSGIDWCVNNASRFNISVISISLGGDRYPFYCNNISVEGGYKTAIDNAFAQNISVVIATGNNGDATKIATPSCIANATAVTSSTKADGVSGFSNRNIQTDLIAPGSSIVSLKAAGTSMGTCTDSGIFRTCSGTSMAAPHASAAFALVYQYLRLEKNQTFTPLGIWDVLNDTGKQIDDTANSGAYFYRVNVWAALQMLDNRTPQISISNPLNNSAVQNISFMVNISSSEVLSDAVLEINNTNFSMSGSGVRWFVNASSMRNGTYSYKVYGNDSFGNANISDTFIINIDTIPPYWSNNATNTSRPLFGQDVMFNITFNDTVTLSQIIFAHNASGVWLNASNATVSGQTQTLIVNLTITATGGNIMGYQFFGIDSAQNSNSTDVFTIQVSNSLPLAQNITLSAVGGLNLSNATLTGLWIFSDADGDTPRDNQTKWYNGTIEQPSLQNLTGISPLNTSKNDTWTFSVLVFDGINWSAWANSTPLFIGNALPDIRAFNYSISVLETQIVNITINATDSDTDDINATVSGNFFTKINLSPQLTSFIWATNISSGGSYQFNVTANDSADISFVMINVTVIDAFDSDTDGNPDFNDTDDDNDGRDDDTDFLIGNSTTINTLLSVNLSVNGTTNVSRFFNGTLPIIITNASNATVLEFNWTFNSSYILNLYNLTINRTSNGSGGIAVRGINLMALGITKTVYLDKINATPSSVCIKDADNASLQDITSSCTGEREILVSCNNQTSSGYTCYNTGTQYKISGLNHSAVKEQCTDADGDGYGSGCAAGADCNDNNAAKTTSCDEGGNSPSGGSGGSGGGGGGGGGAFYVCNMDWNCGGWSACSNGQETRICDFVKVAQHTQNTTCPTKEKPPASARPCSIAIKNETNTSSENAVSHEPEVQSADFFENATRASTDAIQEQGSTDGFPKVYGVYGIFAVILSIFCTGILYYIFRKKKVKNDIP